MCGITCYWAKEAVLSEEAYDALLLGASLRGNDGGGVVIRSPTGELQQFRWVSTYQQARSAILDFVQANMRVGSILFASLRATPETEPMTNLDMLQPIIGNNQCILIHNGGVADFIREELPAGFQYVTRIDSEIILAAYEHKGRNMELTMRMLVGSFAFVMLDERKNKLYAVTSFNPLSHGYIKGYGYVLHSDNEAISNMLNVVARIQKDGLNVWESWYHHPLPGYTILETDIDSGFQFLRKYVPRFIHPVWEHRMDKGEEWLVSASGGIDSSLTAFLLAKAGHRVTLIHFPHGQRSQEAELWAVEQIASYLGIEAVCINLESLFKEIGEQGMLVDTSLPIESGGSKIKSTIAWTCGRNLIFSSVLLAQAEARIVSNKASVVNIASGWAQLSEETGGYPDNSTAFSTAIQEIKNYGLITGSQIEFVPVLQRLTKTECWALGGALGFPFHLTVSCDNPTMTEAGPLLCPQCGSTKLSMLAADRAGVKDCRMFTEPTPQRNQNLHQNRCGMDIHALIDRLILDTSSKGKLHALL